MSIDEVHSNFHWSPDTGNWHHYYKALQSPPTGEKIVSFSLTGYSNIGLTQLWGS